jgi:hypothetical protein
MFRHEAARIGFSFTTSQQQQFDLNGKESLSLVNGKLQVY